MGHHKTKAILIEPFLVVIVSLLWIILLPFAAIFCSGIAISEKVAAYQARSVARPQQAGQPKASPSNPA